MAIRSDITGSNLIKMLIGGENKFSTALLADAAATLTMKQPPVLNGVPTATRILTLPAVTTADDGAFFIIVNRSAGSFDYTINNSSAATIGTISQNEGGLIICLAGAWVVVLVGTST